MNPEAQEKLDEILKKEVHSLTPGDIVFLRARQSYLTEDQKEAYKEVLEIPEPKKERKSRKKK